jgi:uroporphyrin-III C-methyltransferase
MTRRAKVYLVGAGPGDPDLLTVKALRLLNLADVVIYDRLISLEILALVNPSAKLVYAGKEFGEQEAVQQSIYSEILAHLDQANTIVRLKSGDPLIFGRGGEELEFLASHGIEAEVVPGISSATSAPALAGVPLTYRGMATSFAVIAGHRQSVTTLDWGAYAGVDTLVVLMGVEFRDCIAGSLIQSGRAASLPVVFVSRASTSDEVVIESTLGAVARGEVEVESPAVFIIGEVVSLRQRTSRIALAANREILA